MDNGRRSARFASPPVKIQFAELIIPREGPRRGALIGAWCTTWPRDTARFGVFRGHAPWRALSICFCPLHRNHRVKSSSTIMTAGNYKALRSRRDRCPVTVGINVPTCTSARQAVPCEDERGNGFVTRKSHPHLYQSARNFRECCRIEILDLSYKFCRT